MFLIFYTCLKLIFFELFVMKKKTAYVSTYREQPFVLYTYFVHGFSYLHMLNSIPNIFSRHFNLTRKKQARVIFSNLKKNVIIIPKKNLVNCFNNICRVMIFQKMKKRKKYICIFSYY